MGDVNAQRAPIGLADVDRAPLSTAPGRVGCGVPVAVDACARLPGTANRPTMEVTRVRAATPQHYRRMERGPLMPELLVDFIISLDGYASADGWPGFWGLEGPEYLAWLEEAPEREHIVLMGATTYRLMSQFAAAEAEGTGALDSVPKIVFSSTLDEPLAWPNSTLHRGDAVEVVRALKRDGSAPMRTLGSLSLCRSLLTAGLVDRFRVVIFPVITGASGRERIYDRYPDVALELVDHRTFDGRLQLLDYVPRVLDGPPGTG